MPRAERPGHEDPQPKREIDTTLGADLHDLTDFAAMSRVRQARLPLLALCLILTVALGYVGAAEKPGFSANVVDRLYAAIQLFGLENSIGNPVPIAWEIARFAAPAILGATAIGAALLLFREEVLRLRATLTRGHTIVVGLGSRGRRLALALAEDAAHPGRVVVIDPGHHNDALSEAAAAGVAVFVGDGTNPQLLRTAGVRRASHVVFLTSDDLLNLEGAAAVNAAVGTETDVKVRIHVVLRDVELWRSLGPLVVASLAGNAPVEFVSIERRAAAKLVRQLPEGFFDGTHRLALVAEGTLGEALVAETFHRAIPHMAKPRITLVADNAEESLSRLRARNPGLDEVVDITPVVTPPSALPPLLLEAARAADGVIIAEPNERVALAVALYLNREKVVHPGHLILAVPDHALGSVLADESMLGITIVGVLSNTLDRTLLIDGTRERLAEAKHRHFLRQRLDAGERMGSRASMVQWDALEEQFKVSNRRFADDLAIVLQDQGLVIVPRGLGPVDEDPLPLRPDEVDRLARREHRAWMDERVAEGYTYGRVRNDDPKLGPLRHPSLVDFGDLDPEEATKDIEAMKDLPDYLAVAGFTVKRPEDPAS